MSSSRPVCTFSKCNEPITQRLFKCNTCEYFNTCEAICEGCATFCHQGHELVDCGWAYGICACGRGTKACHCFLMHPVDGDSEMPEPNQPRQCQWITYGDEFISDPFIRCRTCNMPRGRNNRCMCMACAHLCHHDHEHYDFFPAGTGNFQCDCPVYDQYNCRLKGYEGPPHPLICERFTHHPDQRKRDDIQWCRTCNYAVCTACARKCHEGHDLAPGDYDVCACAAGKCYFVKNKEPAA